MDATRSHTFCTTENMMFALVQFTFSWLDFLNSVEELDDFSKFERILYEVKEGFRFRFKMMISDVNN
jgi:hypothetical protein